MTAVNVEQAAVAGRILEAAWFARFLKADAGSNIAELKCGGKVVGDYNAQSLCASLVEHAPRLTTLDLSGNELTAVPPALCEIVDLQTLDLSGNAIIDFVQAPAPAPAKAFAPPRWVTRLLGDLRMALALSVAIWLAAEVLSYFWSGFKLLGIFVQWLFVLASVVRLRSAVLRRVSQPVEVMPTGRVQAPAPSPAAASPAAFSNARAGRPTRTPTSTSSPRPRSGRRSATSSASRPGRPIRTTPSRLPACRA